MQFTGRRIEAWSTCPHLVLLAKLTPMHLLNVTFMPYHERGWFHCAENLFPHHCCYQGRNPMSDPREYHIHLIS
jgi:hypothetical protein